MRERVWDKPGFPRLSQRQMALEAGIASTSSYQYLEDDFKGDFFDITQVQQLMGPLVRRGIPPGEAKRKLLGDASARVIILPEQTGRAVPVLARTAVGAIARGEIDVADISALRADVLRDWERAGVIVGWERIPGAVDTVVFFDVADGCGSRIAVDTADRELAEGKSYVLAVGPGREDFVLAEWRGGAMVAAEGGEAGAPVPYDPGADFLLGRVVWFLRPG